MSLRWLTSNTRPLLTAQPDIEAGRRGGQPVARVKATGRRTLVSGSVRGRLASGEGVESASRQISPWCAPRDRPAAY